MISSLCVEREERPHSARESNVSVHPHGFKKVKMSGRLQHQQLDRKQLNHGNSPLSS